MNMLEMMLMVGFGVPIVVLCCAFVICASYMQMKEDCHCRESKAKG